MKKKVFLKTRFICFQPGNKIIHGQTSTKTFFFGLHGNKPQNSKTDQR
jgi:hypothetical protein